MKKMILLPLLMFALAGCTAPTKMPSPSPTSTNTDTPIASILPLPSPTPTAKIVSSPSPTKQPTTKPVTQSVGGLQIKSLPSTFHSDDTRDLQTVDTIVLHSLYNPNSQTPFAIASIKKVLDDEEVSSHFVIDREGVVWQLVETKYQAWHAGVSTMPAPDNRSKVNEFSIGIELVGNETSGYTKAQYDSLPKLIMQLGSQLPIKTITSHADIAPSRKSDPWKFDWNTFEASLSGQKFQILHSE